MRPREVKRVCMVIRPDPMHIPPAVRMANALSCAGLRVELVSGSGRTGAGASADDVAYTVVPFEVGTSSTERLAREFDWLSRLRSYLAKKRYALYYAHGANVLPLVRSVAMRSGRPWVYQAHEFVEYGEGSWLHAAYVASESARAREAALVLCPEPHRANLMQERLRLKEKPLVVWNACEKRQPHRTGRLRRWASMSEGEQIVLYQGGVGPTQHVESVVRSMAYWPLSRHLVFVGKVGSSVKEKLTGLARRAGAVERIHFHPPVSHAALWDYTSDADVGLVLYDGRNRNERFAAPNKLGEYLMAGLPVVHSPLPSLLELLNRRPFASAPNGNRPVDWARAIGDLMQANRLPRAKQAAREFALSEYNFERASRLAVTRLLSLAGVAE